MTNTELENFTISVSWSVDDVLTDRPDLTLEQAVDVLQTVRRQHDASIGINWEVIKTHADFMYPTS